jgi:adenylate kinase family enzyme
MIPGVRLVIIGNSGSGKSTYATRLAATHGLAHLELDGIVWEPNQIAIARPDADVRAELRRFLAEHDRWVVEGCYGDLAELALATATELVFLNPGVDACVANNRRRPWEPHKYATAADQDRMLAPLLAWVAGYTERADPTSYAFHRRLFEAYRGAKRELA